MEMEEDIVIVGAGISGLTTSLGLHRLGLRSLVLEASDTLRTTGFSLTLWKNAWNALDAVGVRDSLRKQSVTVSGLHVASLDSGLPKSDISFKAGGIFGEFEARCIERRKILETLLNALPPGTVRYSSKVVSVEELGKFKWLYLGNGSIIKTKVLIGCDGINSGVAKWLGLHKPIYAGRSVIRGLAEFPNGHGYEPIYHMYFGAGIRYGFVPCDEKSFYWFCTYLPSSFQNDEGAEENPVKLKQFVLSKINGISREAIHVVEKTKLHNIICAPLTLRFPLNILLGNIVKNNVCVVGDAFHPMTPEVGEGGCSALEDSVVLARCLAEAFLCKGKRENFNEEFERIKRAMKKYGKERRWRSFSLITISYLVGLIQQSDWKVLSFLREKWLARYTSLIILRVANFDFGSLVDSS